MCLRVLEQADAVALGHPLLHLAVVRFTLAVLGVHVVKLLVAVPLGGGTAFLLEEDLHLRVVGGSLGGRKGALRFATRLVRELERVLVRVALRVLDHVDVVAVSRERLVLDG